MVRQFVKGDPRINRKGAPKKEWTWSGLLRQFADENVEGYTRKELVASALYNQAIKGNVYAIKELGDRLEGKTAQLERPSEKENMQKEHSKQLYEAIKKAI